MIYQAFNQVRIRLGIDKSIFWATLNKSFSIIKAPLSIYFIIQYLTPKDQGLWYTFNSLGALTIFAELGFAAIITQFVSHEFAKLSERSGAICGENNKVDRLFSLIKFSIKTYLFVIPAAILLLLLVGYFYFKVEASNVYLAWVLFSIVGGFNLFLGLFQSIYQGLNKVKDIQINAFICILIGTVANWTMLALNFKIWSLVVGNFLGLFVATSLLYKSAPKFWHQLIRHRGTKGKYNFFKETIALQIKYAISWVSGYFIFFISVPATYKYAGEAKAGQLGITMAVIAAINGIASNWISTKIPRFNMLVSNGESNVLETLFKSSLRQTLLIQAVLSICFIGGLFFLHFFLPLYSVRFLEISLTSLLLISQLAQTLISAMAIYLRSFKKEPFVYLSIINAVLMIGAVFFILKEFGFTSYIIAESVILGVIILPLAYCIYKKQKQMMIAHV